VGVSLNSSVLFNATPEPLHGLETADTDDNNDDDNKTDTSEAALISIAALVGCLVEYFKTVSL
jgi:hypothetical protein